MSDRIVVQVPPAADGSVAVAELLTQCGQQYPQLASWLPHVRVAVNCEYVAGTGSLLHAGDEIALLPPVAGGSF